jgi:hypothetical protein
MRPACGFFSFQAPILSIPVAINYKLKEYQAQ